MSSTPKAKIPVIIDTDPGVDDVIALLLALASPELEILAIIISYGNTDRTACWKNVFKLYKVLDLHFEKHPEDKARFPNFAQSRKTIVAKGVEQPLKGEIHNAQYFHGRDGLSDVGFRHPEMEFEGLEDLLDHAQLEVSNKSGIEVALDIIKAERARSITYIALGPLTDLSLMMSKDPVTVRERLGRVCCMGGAIDVPGNASPAAEFNFYADPYAVHNILTPDDPGSGFPLERFLMLPLDVTTPHEFSFPLYKSKVDRTFDSTASPSDGSVKSPLVHFTSSVFERTREIMLHFGKDAFELHDPVAVWCAIENPPAKEEVQGKGPVLQQGWKSVRRQFQVERPGEITRGMLVVDRRMDPGAYAPKGDHAHYQEEDVEHGESEPLVIPAQIEVDEYMGIKDGNEGVPTVTRTPGRSALVAMLLERIWGAK